MAKFNFDEFSRGLTEGIKNSASRPNILGYVPQDEYGHPQKNFHISNARGKLFCGGNRSGKTVSGATEAVWWCSKTHPYKDINARYPEPIRGRAIGVDFVNGIEKILKPEVRRWIAPSMLINGSWEDSYNSNSKTLTFANGSFIEFMSYDQDLDKFAGTSRHFTWFDEEPPLSIYNECMMRLVDTAGDWWMTLTPIEGGSGWINFDIYEPATLGLLPHVEIFNVSTDMNIHVDSGEMDLLMGAGTSEEERKIRKEGKFMFLTGLVFDKWSPNVHVVKQPPLEIIQNPRNRIWVGVDPGLREGSFTWNLISPSGRILTFHEFTMKELTVQEYANYYHEYNSKMGITPEMVIADPAFKQRSHITGYSIQVEYSMRGIPMAEGNNDVPVGLNKMRQYIGIPGETTPMWTISEECALLIKNMQRYRFDEWANKKQAEKNEIKQTPKKKDDHNIDACRYVFSHMPDLELKDEPRPRHNFHDALEFEKPVTTYDVGFPFRTARSGLQYDTVWTQCDSEIGEF